MNPNLLSLLFNLFWVVLFTLILAIRRADKHYVFWLGCAVSLMLSYELYREVIIEYWHVERSPTPLRVWVYGAEHILLGMIFTEALHYVEICKKHRKRSRRLD